MSLFKKIISSVCALGMLSTLAVFSVGVQAEEIGAVKAEVTDYNSETGEGTVTVSLTGVSDILAAYGGTDWATIEGFANDVYLEADDFDTSLYGNVPPGNPPYRQNIVKTSDWTGTFTPGAYGTKVDGGFVISCVSMKGTDSTSPITDDVALYEFSFKVNDTSKDNTITLRNAYVTLNTYDQNDFSLVVVTQGDAGYGSTNTDNTLGIENTVTEGVGGDITITIPANDGTTAEGDNLVSIAPEDIGGEGTVWADDEGNGEAAVASVANFTSNNAGSVTWSITATPAEGEAVTKSHAFDIPAVEGQMTLGLIVGYDTAEWNSVAITGGAIE